MAFVALAGTCLRVIPICLASTQMLMPASKVPAAGLVGAGISETAKLFDQSNKNSSLPGRCGPGIREMTRSAYRFPCVDHLNPLWGARQREAFPCFFRPMAKSTLPMGRLAISGCGIRWQLPSIWLNLPQCLAEGRAARAWARARQRKCIRNSTQLRDSCTMNAVLRIQLQSK